MKLKHLVVLPILQPGQLLGPSTSTHAASCGVASWYGPRGGRTASGERFNRWNYTAASPWRRLGSRVTVINRRTGHRVRVRINDRLPYGHADLDLSYGAFKRIASPRKGLAKICVIHASTGSESI